MKNDTRSTLATLKALRLNALSKVENLDRTISMIESMADSDFSSIPNETIADDTKHSRRAAPGTAKALIERTMRESRQAVTPREIMANKTTNEEHNLARATIYNALRTGIDSGEYIKEEGRYRLATDEDRNLRLRRGGRKSRHSTHHNDDTPSAPAE